MKILNDFAYNLNWIQNQLDSYSIELKINVIQIGGHGI